MLLIGLTGSIATGKSTVSTLLTSPPHSLPLIDADLLARKVVEPGTRGYDRIVEYFGPSTPDLLLPPPPPSPPPLTPTEDGSGQGEAGGEKRTGMAQRPLNRAALGRRVFGDTPSKKRDRMILNEIIHPAVRWEIYRSLLYYYVRGYWAVVLDIPLLFESGLDLICGSVVVVAVGDPEVQIQRLLERDHAQGGGMTREEAEGRVGSQWDVGEKVGRCEMRDRGFVFGGGGGGGGGGGQGRGLVVWNDGGKEELRAKVGKVVEILRRRNPVWWNWVCLCVPPVALVAGLWQLVRNLVDRWRWERRQKREKAKL